MTHDDPTSGENELARALRVHYAAPVDEGYWEALEARIVAHVAHAAQRPVWWGELAEMARPGLVAAAALILAASIAMARSRHLEDSNDYASVMSAPSALSESSSHTASVGDGDAAIHFLLSR